MGLMMHLYDVPSFLAPLTPNSGWCSIGEPTLSSPLRSDHTNIALPHNWMEAHYKKVTALWHVHVSGDTTENALPLCLSS